MAVSPLLIGAGALGVAFMVSRQSPKKKARRKAEKKFADALEGAEVSDEVDIVAEPGTAVVVTDGEGTKVGVSVAAGDGTIVTKSTQGTILEEPGFAMEYEDDDGNMVRECADAQGNDMDCAILDKRLREARASLGLKF